LLHRQKLESKRLESKLKKYRDTIAFTDRRVTTKKVGYPKANIDNKPKNYLLSMGVNTTKAKDTKKLSIFDLATDATNPYKKKI